MVKTVLSIGITQRFVIELKSPIKRGVLQKTAMNS